MQAAEKARQHFEDCTKVHKAAAAEYSNAQHEVKSAQGVVNGCQRDLKAFESKLKDLGEQWVAKSKEKDELQVELNKLKGIDIDELKAYIEVGTEEEKDEAQSALAKFEASQQSLAALDEELAKLQKDKDAASALLTEAQKKIVTAQEELDAKNEVMKQAQIKKDAKDQLLRDARAEVKAADKDMEEKKYECDKTQRRNSFGERIG